ncbi:MAG: hypothetical protein AAGA22_00375 [Pseudomonadota bacterium]
MLSESNPRSRLSSILWSAGGGLIVGGLASAVSLFLGVGGADRAIIGFSIAFVFVFPLLLEMSDRVRSFLAALVLAGLVAVPIYHSAQTMDDPTGRTQLADGLIWFTVAAPLGALLLVALTKAYILGHASDEFSNYDARARDERARDERVRAADASYFLHALTLPLVIGIMLIGAAPAAALLGLGGLAMGSDMQAAVSRSASSSVYGWPIMAAFIAAAISFVRGQTALLGALRFAVVAAARLVSPAIAVAAIMLALFSFLGGPWATVRTIYASGVFLAFGATIWLSFSAVRQSGEGGAPPLWIRIPTIAALLIMPVFVWFAYQGLSIRIETYGLTPVRILGLGAVAIAGLHALGGIVCIAMEATSTPERWMPGASKVTASLGLVTALMLLIAGSPLIDPLAISANNQSDRLLDGDVDAEKFDYAFLRFELGPAGDDALDRVLTVSDHSQAATIRANIELVRRFEARESYDAYVLTRGAR